MRKSISISVLLLLISLIGFAQNQKYDSIFKLRKEKIKKELLQFNHSFLLEKQKNKSKKNLLKSELSEKSKLDSTLSKYYNPDGKFTDSEKNIYLYDAQGKDSIETQYYYNSENEKWNCLGKYETFYYANGNMKEIIYSFEVEGTFTKHSKDAYEFDTQNRLIKLTNNQWDADANKWIVYKGESYTYDENGNLKQEERFHSSINQKTVYKYNENGKKVVSIDYGKFEDEEWSESTKDSSTYDLIGNEKKIFSFFWDYDNKKWDSSYYREFKYDSLNNIIEDITYTLSNQTGEWVLDYKIGYKYDAKGRLIEAIDYFYDDYKEIFINDTKFAYNYDIANNFIQFNSSEWDEEEEVWVDLIKIVYTLDNKISSNDLIKPIDFEDIYIFEMNRELHIEFDVDVKILDYSVYDIDEKTKEFYLWEKHTLYYSEESTVIKNSNENIENNTNITISPNPIDEYISITIHGDYNNAVFELFNSQGVKVKCLSVNNSQTYSLSDLQTGMYSYKLNVDGKIRSGKLQKR